MKKKLSVLLIGSLVAMSLAGCSGTNKPVETSSIPSDSSVESTTGNENTSGGESSVKNDASTNEKSETNTEKSNGENSIESTVSEDEEDIGPKEGDIIVDEDGNEYIYHENEEFESAVSGDEEDPMPVTSDGKEEQPKLLDVTFTPIDVKDTNVEPDVIDMSAPEYYLISNSAELGDFVSKYEKTYSLNTVESGVDFNTIAEKFDDTYFEHMSVVVIPVEYDKDTETEIGTITIDGDNYVIEVCTQLAESKEKSNTLCFVVQTYKSDMEGKNVVIKVVTDSIIEEGGEEI